MTMALTALPDLAYDHLRDPAEAHRLIGEARALPRSRWVRTDRKY